jgi:O-acetylhomoserine/O-acetylserine sulfhydrylase-like pyridoxal-dependent enzyme
MKEFGLQVTELTEADRAEFAAIIKDPTRAKFFELTGDEGKALIKRVDDKIAELQK